MAADKSFQEVNDDVSSALVNTTRTAGQISNEDLSFQRSSDPDVARLLDQQGSRLLGLIQKLNRSAAEGSNVTAPRLSDVESVDDNWRSIVDLLDSLLEKADACLDEYTGVIKKSAPIQQNHQPLQTIPNKRLSAREYRDQNVPKPQLLFRNLPKNTETVPFQPLLRSKPHAITALQPDRQISDDDGNLTE